MYEYRLIEITSYPTLRYEEGPGSTAYADIEREDTRVLEEWRGDEKDAEEFKHLSQEIVYRVASERHTEYRLERRERRTDSEWDTVTSWRVE